MDNVLQKGEIPGSNAVDSLTQAFTQFITVDNIIGFIRDGFHITFKLGGTAAATPGNYGFFFTAEWPCEVISITEIHEGACTSGFAVLDIRKPTGTTTSAGGNSLLSSTFDLTAPANTLIRKDVTGGLTGTRGDKQLARGDRLTTTTSGTLTNTQGVLVTVYLKFLGRGDYK